SGTREAVRNFQSMQGLEVDGKVGSGTVTALNQVIAGSGISGLPPAPKGSGPQVVSPSDLPPAKPQRVILHWTGGTGRASALDRSHYHFLIEEDGTIIKGTHGIDANDRSHKHPRASHTRMLNTHSVGISMCGMHNARERPFDPGRFPLREIQVERMAKLVAQICQRYDIPVERRTVLGHGEVQDILNVTQRFKWDPLVLPWRTDLNFRETGDYLRDLIRAAMVQPDDEDSDGEDIDLRDLSIAGKILRDGALNYDTASWLRMDAVCDAMNWPKYEKIGLLDDDSHDDEADGIRLIPEDTPLILAYRMVPMDAAGQLELCVKVEDLAEALEMGVELSADAATIMLTGKPGGLEQDSSGTVEKFVTIRRGDTLSAVAKRELGDSSLWRKLRDDSGRPFTLAMARNIQAGQRVMLPQGGGRPAPQPVTGLTENLIAEASRTVGAAADPGNKRRAAEALPGILKACYKWGVTDLSQIAYVLATAQHECNFGHPMVEHWTNSAAQQKYEHSKLNSETGDGQKFKGRGYVQLTFRYNYKRYGDALGMDFLSDPKVVERPEIAAEVLVYGMSQMGFTGPSQILAAYGEGANFDFDGARRMINGDKHKFERRYGMKKGPAIGNRARKFRDALAEAGLPG
ncbi:MAG: N-acetylmuramoyl-L-alanine amidase, partial [Mangrovicoccus sp.]